MFACPNCGGNVKFDISSQQLKCEYCQSQMDPYSFDNKEKDAIESKEFEVTFFSCPQCGGEIMSTDTSAAEFCSFCGASTILYSRLAKEKRPDYIIPFQKTKEDCKKAYAKMMKQAPFAPDALKNSDNIDSFRGIYMPYWAFHLTQQKPFSLSGTKQKRQGDYIYTDYYSLQGELDAYYKGLSYDASSSFDDNISEKLAPYDVRGMKAFTPAYLSGFYADTADVEPGTYQNHAESVACSTSTNKIYSSFPGVSISSSLTNDDLDTKTEAIDRTMFPVWFMSYRNGDRVAYATINGQTGRVVCDLPVDPKTYLMISLVFAIPIFILLNLFLTITPPALLAFAAILGIICMIIFRTEISSMRKKGESVKNVKSFGQAILLISLFAALIIGFAKPANDLFYYGCVILTLISVFLTFKDIISCYNILATRRLPQFDRTGGDDRA